MTSLVGGDCAANKTALLFGSQTKPWLTLAITAVHLQSVVRCVKMEPSIQLCKHVEISEKFKVTSFPDDELLLVLTAREPI